jgi:NAD(P)-dependent dehydrogenase (short-subunit alcohol dehydrogenase family)
MPFDPDRMRLDGRWALVTGAAAGIGAATARALAAFGADVALCDRDAAGLEATARDVAALGREAHGGVFDVRDADAVRRFVSEVGEGRGRLDILVNNAGGGFEAPLLELSDGGLDALVRENFLSVTAFLRAAAPWLAADGGGSVVNVTSVEAHRAAPGYAVYAAMKAAVESLTRSLSLEWAERGIRVNSIAPDAIPTPGTGHRAPPTPLRRSGEPDDVAGAACFLASDLAAFVTGTTLHVDGGTRAAGGWRRDGAGRFVL